MTRRLLEQKTTKAHFSLPMTSKQANDFITAAYIAEVEYRGLQYIESEHIKTHIEILARFLTNPSKFGVVICGTYGNGKTTLLYALRSTISFLAKNGYLEKRDISLDVYDARELTKLYRDRDPETFGKICRTKLVAIEDMGKEPTEAIDYGTVISPVVELLERRYDGQLFTVVTTNLTPKEIREKYGARIADRFNEMMLVLNFGNAMSFRGIKPQ